MTFYRINNFVFQLPKVSEYHVQSVLIVQSIYHGCRNLKSILVDSAKVWIGVCFVKNFLWISYSGIPTEKRKNNYFLYTFNVTYQLLWNSFILIAYCTFSTGAQKCAAFQALSGITTFST